ncbi:MAG: UDP-N-acetylglucosamine--N-acetylmuramyl-(pentapeptide) pyrophosphoryl-undecaprenol N-acetylglucosamine transferase, partial [Candidatus Omnitrophica bacterium]|nr:UDP-N-acetylglucosamine--N-acetylmuramyl-(pentapeptide) pyrophosphoryl-undecaprenol N-acetylglucosamine transferase [Candidatus Omnitrophota bacterium]
MKILVVAGASAGHIFPALGLLEHLRRAYPYVSSLLVVPEKNAVGKSARLWPDIRLIAGASVGLRLSGKNLKGLLQAFRGAVQSLRIIIDYKPDIVVGFGSIASVPMILFGWLLRTRTVLHEQNVVPGRANRFLARFADTVCVSFAETGQSLGISGAKVKVTGNPLRTNLARIGRKESRAFFALDPDKFTLLVMGGSQGSVAINRKCPDALSALAAKDSFQVIHLSGEAAFASVSSAYRTHNIKARVFGFLQEMEYAYSAADLAVCRAGATTLAELKHYRLPAVFIPYPFAYE